MHLTGIFVYNRCNLDRLKATKEPLPGEFDPHFQGMWSAVSKIIDGLHLQNHRRDDCKLKYNPDHFAESHPGVAHADTMAAEQQFSRLGKYRKQMNSMTKENQLFFLHRICVRYNEYNARCLREGWNALAISPRSENERAGI